MLCVCVCLAGEHIYTLPVSKRFFFFIIFFLFYLAYFFFGYSIGCVLEALMMMGPVNFIIEIQSVACRTDGLIGGLLAGLFDFRRNMQGVLVL